MSKKWIGLLGGVIGFLSVTLLALVLSAGLRFWSSPSSTPSPPVIPSPPPSQVSPPPTPPKPPPFREVILGLSVEGREIRAAIWNEGSGQPTLIIATMHGDERLSGQLGDRLYEFWKEQPEELAGAYVILIPRLNPDGWEHGTRVNAHGVDLNRNFPDEWQPAGSRKRYFSGEKPLSEPESQLLAEVVEKYQPAKIISIHQPLHNLNYDGPSLALAQEMAKFNHYPIVDNIGYPTPGSFGIFAGKVRGIPTITLELEGGSSLEKIWEDNYPALLAAIRFSPPGPSSVAPESLPPKPTGQ